ncbi:efflux transporter outer membrane subunit [Candidatus Pantoea multigeneris]|uniref:Efflux transporter outer membrane subunit n=1 Tax=Candidatus Pantoea multigeneris TaxID=2608357 RepID=A0ABX0RFG5_9GAMM|nr:efflux transporter outer membrane subunit [Pantoea multigeneris]NIF24083.1 efflux transporter outer membrane subunit [Pantoea multigeneris]
MTIPFHAQRRAMLGVAIASALLAGCANPHGLHTSNHKLDANTLQASDTLKSAKLSPANWPKAEWWKGFNDGQLNRLIGDAMASSPDLQVVNAQAAKANAGVIAAQAARYPTLDANAGITRSRVAKVDDPLLQGKSYSTLRTANLSASYTFDLWGGQKDAAEAAIGAARASELDTQASKLTLAANVTRGWINLNLAWAKQKLAKDTLDRADGIAKIQQQYVSAGLASDYQYKQALSQQRSAQSSLTAAKQAVTDAGIQLSTLVGKGPDYWHSLKPTTINIPVEATLPTTIPADLLGRRPDVVAARWRVEAASKTIAATRTEFYPNINLVAEAGTRSLLGDALFGAPSRFFNVGPSLSLPIFDGGKRRADLAASNADYDLAVARYNQLLISSVNNISDTITQMASLQDQIAQEESADELIHSSWEDLHREYTGGLRPYLDVLSIQNQLIESDEKMVELKAQQINLAVVLIENLGGGFQP